MISIKQLYSQKLPTSFYRQPGVVDIAQSLIGKLLITRFEGKTTMGRIIETEAYDGIADKASHAYGGRYTPRTAVMYAPGGVAYVYLCYGIHVLFNVVTGSLKNPQAILIRGLEPVHGMETMLSRTQKISIDKTITRGPGHVSKALGIQIKHSGLDLQSPQLFLADDNFSLAHQQVIATPRIGVDFAEDHAAWPYRFIISGHPNISGKKSQNVL